MLSKAYRQCHIETPIWHSIKELTYKTRPQPTASWRAVRDKRYHRVGCWYHAPGLKPCDPGRPPFYISAYCFNQITKCNPCTRITSAPKHQLVILQGDQSNWPTLVACCPELVSGEAGGDSGRVPGQRWSLRLMFDVYGRTECKTSATNCFLRSV